MTTGRRLRAGVVSIGLLFAVSFTGSAQARELVFAETWENGMIAWRTLANNGGDCKGWPQCNIPGATAAMPPGMAANPMVIKDSAGGECGGKYLRIPWQVAGDNDGGNVVVTGGVNNNGDIRKNAQFKVTPGDRLCVVAWVRNYPEVGALAGSWAGPYVGINYTGAHGIVDAGHNHGTHWVIGPFGDGAHDTAGDDPQWPLTRRQSYPNIVQTVRDGQWHRYKTDFVVGTNPYDTFDSRRFSPELGAGQTWATTDTNVYAQPRLSLFGKPGDGSAAFPYTRSNVNQVNVTKDGDFGDIFFFRATAAPEMPCPTDAELDALAYSSDHVVCGAGKACIEKVAALPATSAPAGTPAYPGNKAYTCMGCNTPFGGTPGVQTCGETTPFCLNATAPKGGDCAACTNDAGGTGEAATRCAAANPLCKPDGACGKCTADDACSDAALHAGPSCNAGTGECFKCATDQGIGAPAGQCTKDKPRCDAATGLCGKCTTNADCANPDGTTIHGGPVCDPGSGTCVSCSADFGGPAGPTTCAEATPHCDVAAPVSGRCSKCATNADCVNPTGKSVHAGPVCAADKGLCGKCDGDQEVSQGPYGCKGDTPTCSKDGACIKCKSDDDCVNPEGVRLHARASCNTGTGVCEGKEAPVPGVSGSGDESGGSCGCSVPGASSGTARVGLLGALFGVIVLGARRRRRRA